MAQKEPPRKSKQATDRPRPSITRSKGQPVRQGHGGKRKAVRRQENSEVTWSQLMPGKGLDPVRVKRQGKVIVTKGDTVLVRPTDNPSTLILMDDPRQSCRPPRPVTGGHQPGRIPEDIGVRRG